MKYTRIYADRNRCTGARGRLDISVRAGQSAIANDPESVVYLGAAPAFPSDRGLGRACLSPSRVRSYRVVWTRVRIVVSDKDCYRE